MRSPLFDILTQINIAADNGLDLLALSLAVALPDICCSLISDNGRTDREKYKEWCKENLKDGFHYVTPDDLYSMRCGVLHNGRFGDLKHRVSQVVFVPKGGNTFTNCLMDDVYLYSVDTFCLNMNRAVVTWYAANKDNANVLKNISRLMQYRQNGAFGIQGLPVIA